MNELIEFGRVTPLLIFAPFVYFFVGLPFARWSRCLPWAPLWGAGICGWLAEFAVMAHLPEIPTLAAGMGFTAVVGAFVFIGDAALRTTIRRELHSFLHSYLWSLAALSAAAFAFPGSWGGDWAIALDAGLRIFKQQRFIPELLSRPPFFGAAAIPLFLTGHIMPGYQIFCAIGSACAVQVFKTGIKLIDGYKTSLILIGSICFLQITANAWPKLLAAAYVVAAWQHLANANMGRRVFAGLLFGLALATHQSSLLYCPLLVARIWLSARSRRAFLLSAPLFLAAAAAVAAPWELYTILDYGLKAKVLANPSVAQRIPTVPAWLNGALVGLTTFVAWGPIDVLIHWARSPDRFHAVRIAHELYWVLASLGNCCAGSLLGLAAPWAYALGVKDLWARLRRGWGTLDPIIQGALWCALALQMILNPYYSADGTLQTGWVPMALFLTIWFAGEIRDLGPLALTSILRSLWRLNAIPWLGYNLAIAAALKFSAKARAEFVDPDLQLLSSRKLTPLGLGCFPWLQTILALVLILWTIRSNKSNEQDQPPLPL